MRAITGFEWDAGNRKKCQKHGVSVEEIEELFHRDPAVYADPDHSLVEQRLRAIGRTAERRAVLVAFTIRETGGGAHIRPISARYMHKKEVDRYEKA